MINGGYGNWRGDAGQGARRAAPQGQAFKIEKGLWMMLRNPV